MNELMKRYVSLPLRANLRPYSSGLERCRPEVLPSDQASRYSECIQAKEAQLTHQVCNDAFHLFKQCLAKK
jgi:hypothetical protein